MRHITEVYDYTVQIHSSLTSRITCQSVGHITTQVQSE